MKISRAYELCDNGGPVPTWRPMNPYAPRRAIKTALRRETNRRIKKDRLVFMGSSIRAY